MTAPSSRQDTPPGKNQRNDLIFLTMVVVISVLPYVSRLGFYSDDWASLGAMTTASDQSVKGLVAVQLSSDPDGRARLTNTVYQALLVRAFGLNPLGYHVVNALVLVSAALLLYLTLCELGLQPPVAVSIAAVYILLPNYSTDRFWFVAFGYVSSMALFFAGSYAFLRSARSKRMVPWTACGVAALAASALGMEVFVPLMLAIPAALLWQSHRLYPGGLRRQLATPRGVLLPGSALAVIAAVAVYKSGTARGFYLPNLVYLEQLVAGALAVNFGTYGIALPHTVAWSLRQLPPVGAALGALLGILVFLYLSRREAPPASARAGTALVVAGCAAFGLGTAIFLTNARVLYWSAGIANRVWIAAALGVALVLVGGSVWVTLPLPGTLRRRAFSGLIAILCMSGFAINTAFATFWIAAWQRELEVVANIRQALPNLAPRTTLILDGVCPYLGPAIVFESSWDLTGALRIAYNDRSLRADVTTGRFSVQDDGLRTRIYGNSEFYSYGRDLLLFDGRHGRAIPLTDGTVARANLSEPAACPDGNAGQGTVSFPADVWYQNGVSRGFRPWR